MTFSSNDYLLGRRPTAPSGDIPRPDNSRFYHSKHREGLKGFDHFLETRIFEKLFVIIGFGHQVIPSIELVSTGLELSVQVKFLGKPIKLVFIRNPDVVLGWPKDGYPEIFDVGFCFEIAHARTREFADFHNEFLSL